VPPQAAFPSRKKAMQRTLILSLTAIASIAVSSRAQNCSGPAPAGSLNTGPFANSTTYLGAPNATAGTNMFFDLVATADLAINRVDVNVLDDGSVGTPPNPNLVGQTTQLQFWTVPTTWQGNINNLPAWTLLGTGTLTVAAPDQHSIALFTPAFTLPTGTWGVALTHLPVTTGTVTGPLHPLYINPTAAPGTPLVYSDQYLTLTAGAVQSGAWLTGVGATRVINTEIFYQPSANAGYTVRFGTGCYDFPQSWYEYQAGGATPTNWDLNGTSAHMIFSAAPDYYTVVPGALTVTPSASAALTTVGNTYDDDITAAQALPFTFPYPGGSTSSIIVSTNGHVFLGTSTATFGPYSFPPFFSDVPRLACAWSDWDLTTQGTMHFDTTATTATITWNNVQEWAAAGSFGSNTFQIVMHSTGDVDYIWQAVAHTAPPLVVGFGRGNGTSDPGSIDLSASFPLIAGDGRVPPILGMNPRPVIGTTPSFETTNITAGTLFCLIAFSFTSQNTPLGFVNMPGCNLYVGLPATSAFGAVVGSTNSVPLQIPNNMSYNGLSLYAQSAPLTSGFNPAGIVTSNGLCVHIGLQ
jgi:hypothetical protein